VTEYRTYSVQYVEGLDQRIRELEAAMQGFVMRHAQPRAKRKRSAPEWVTEWANRFEVLLERNRDE